MREASSAICARQDGRTIQRIRRVFAAPVRSVIPSSSALAALLNPYLLARSAADVTDEATLAVDFSDISKEFALEKARVRTFRRLEDIFALCMLAYVFMIGHVKRSKRFSRIVKALSDSAADIALRTHSHLAGIRTLAS